MVEVWSDGDGDGDGVSFVCLIVFGGVVKCEMREFWNYWVIFGNGCLGIIDIDGWVGILWDSCCWWFELISCGYWVRVGLGCYWKDFLFFFVVL